MNRSFHILLPMLLAGLVACEPPGEVQIRDQDAGVDVTSLVEPDTVFRYSPIDTIAVLPSDQIGFDGSFVVNEVRYDGGNGIVRFSYARAFVGDLNRPVSGNGGTWGYHGFHLGSISLNGQPMIERSHFVLGVDSIVFAGFEYVSWEGFSYEPGTTYTWRADSIGGPGVSVQAPASLEVTAPRGGVIVLRDQPLQLSWNSDGETNVVVSRVQRVGRPRPMLHLHPWHDGYAVVSPKVLQLLPEDGTYLLTFIRASRKEVMVNRTFLNGEVLVQAASVHNVVIQLR